MEGESMRQSPNATLEQAAKFLQVSPRTVQNLQIRGLLKPVHLGYRRFFHWAELEKLARKGVSVDSETQAATAARIRQLREMQEAAR